MDINKDKCKICKNQLGYCIKKCFCEKTPCINCILFQKYIKKLPYLSYEKINKIILEKECNNYINLLMKTETDRLLIGFDDNLNPIWTNETNSKEMEEVCDEIEKTKFVKLNNIL